MLLTYSRYLTLLSALDEHTRCTMQKFELQNAIYNHYIVQDGYIVAENALRERMIFYSYHYNCGKSDRTKYRKQFRAFMDKITKKI